MCKYRTSEHHCTITKEKCNQKPDYECIIYISYEEMIRE